MLPRQVASSLLPKHKQPKPTAPRADALAKPHLRMLQANPDQHPCSMKTDAQIRMTGMQALIGALGLVDAQRFLAVVSRDKLDYTHWRQNGLPAMTLEDMALQANQLANGEVKNE